MFLLLGCSPVILPPLWLMTVSHIRIPPREHVQAPASAWLTPYSSLPAGSPCFYAPLRGGSSPTWHLLALFPPMSPYQPLPQSRGSSCSPLGFTVCLSLLSPQPVATLVHLLPLALPPRPQSHCASPSQCHLSCQQPPGACWTIPGWFFISGGTDFQGLTDQGLKPGL